ncbi:MAG: DUF6464 family protein [Thermosynechococcaceae cyanobacterium MS004]|nr:DUF6464 family protein [Thermosynechococcaceae cyanobacterium MS004]
MIFNLLAILGILTLGLAPMLLSIWGIHYLARHPRLYRGRGGHVRRSQQSSFQWMNLYWLDPAGYVGDTSCRFNAHSPLLRCAVNPGGPCQGCVFYEGSPHLN